MGQTHSPTIGFCADVAKADELAAFFAATVSPEYISHSELQGPRAIDVGRWRPGIESIFRDEIATRIADGGGKVPATGASYPILEARSDGRLGRVQAHHAPADRDQQHGVLRLQRVHIQRRQPRLGQGAQMRPQTAIECVVHPRHGA